MKLSRKLLIGLPIALIVLVVGGTWIYIHVIEGDPPAKLSLDSGSGSTSTTAAGGAGDTTSSASGSGVDGTWKVTTGSQAGYRVKEVLFGQNATAVGRTSEVTGSIVVNGTKIPSGTFTVNLTNVTSDQSRRDGQFRRVMDVASNPTTTFTLTQPIDVGTIPADGAQVPVNATGTLALHGTTKTVTAALQAQRSGNNIKVAGTIPIVFADYGIANPSAGPAQTEDKGVVEFLLVFAK